MVYTLRQVAARYNIFDNIFDNTSSIADLNLDAMGQENPIRLQCKTTKQVT